MEDPKNSEGAWAGVLNGAMFTVLGAALPGLILWQVLTHWRDLVSGAHEMTWLEAAQGVVIVGLSAQLISLGVSMIARHARWLRRRRT
jgi:CDP-diglyceride synthetase